MSLLWIPATIIGASLQVARNALQRGMIASSGPWGATLVRFLFGLPFSILFVAVVAKFSPNADPHYNFTFWTSASVGALAQLLATTTLLVSMERVGFAVASTLQHVALPIAALIGFLVYGDPLSEVAWIGVFVTTAGLVTLTWPSRRASGPKPVSGAIYGLLSGLCFGLSLNAFRHASIALEPHESIYAALMTVAIVQALQSAGLSLFLIVTDRSAVHAVIKSWKQSLGAGCTGATASAFWFVALSLSPAAPVRAVGTISAPIAAFAGHRVFRERLTLKQILAGLTVLGGVVLTTLY
jgi:drug/metabolite transporter (DMT)-like permease